MFSRRSILKFFGAAAAAPALTVVAKVVPAYDPVSEVVWNYGERMWIDWARNAIVIKDDAAREQYEAFYSGAQWLDRR